MKNPPTIRSGNVGEKIQTGMSSNPRTAATMIVRRRPQRCEIRAENRAAADRAQIVNDRHRSGLIDRKSALLLQKGRVQILGAVRHVIEGRHEQDGVNEQPPVLRDHPAHA